MPSADEDKCIIIIIMTVLLRKNLSAKTNGYNSYNEGPLTIPESSF